MTRYGTDGEKGKVDSYPQPLHERDIYIGVKMKPEDWYLRPACKSTKGSSYDHVLKKDKERRQEMIELAKQMCLELMDIDEVLESERFWNESWRRVRMRTTG